MKVIRILAIAPYEGMAETLSSLSENRADIEMTIRTGNLQEGLEIAMTLTARRDYDVIISRGGTAELIRKELDMLVIDAPLSVYDILRSIKMAENYAGKFAIAGFHGITDSARMLCDLLQLDIDIFTFLSQEEVRPLLQKLKKQNYSLVVCDMIGSLTAQSIGLNSIFIPSGTESINSAIDEAVKMVNSSIQTYKQKEIFKAALTSNSESVLIFQENGNLWFSNLTSMPFDAQLLNMVQTFLPAFIKTNHQTYERNIGNITCRITNEHITHDNSTYTLLRITKKPLLFEESDKAISIYNDFEETSPDNMVRQSSANFIGNVHTLIEKYAPTTFPVLITGETGTGKERAAALLYKHGPYSDKPYYVIDCNLLTERKWNTLLRSENSPLNSINATIHIKDIGKLDKTAISKLFTYIEDTNLTKRNRLIFSLIAPSPEAESLKKHLANRLSCLLLPISPLRERAEDLSGIAMLYINQMNTLLGKQIVGFEADAFTLIKDFCWPNNLDQFRRVIKEAMLLTDTSYITASTVDTLLKQEADTGIIIYPHAYPSPLDLNQTLDEITYSIIKTVMAEEGMNKEKTAKRLGISRSTLWRTLKSHEE